jgi:hypothetical protein
MIRITVDGRLYDDEVEPRMLLVHYLRDRLGRTGTTIGCDTWRSTHITGCSAVTAPRHDHGCGGLLLEELRSVRGAGAARHGGQPVPLHGLPATPDIRTERNVRHRADPAVHYRLEMLVRLGSR